MALPDADSIRELLEGYGIADSVVTDARIIRFRDKEIVPHVENITGLKFSAEQTITEYYSGNGSTVLILNRKPVNSIENITYITSIVQSNLADAVELIGEEGIVKAKTNYSEAVYNTIFLKGHKNIKVTYKYGYDDYPDDVSEAIANLVAAKVLNLVGARTGGGSINIQGVGRNYGNEGKYMNIRKELVKMAYWNLKTYMTGVVGS